MASKEEHLELSDLLYTKARQLNQSEDVVSNILSAECVLVSFDHLVDASVKSAAQNEIKKLIEESENARHIIKAGIFR